MNEELKEQIASLSNEELMKMVRVDSAEYQGEALSFAKEELKKRNLEVDQVQPGIADIEYICSKCGINVTKEDKVCPKCGTDLSVIKEDKREIQNLPLRWFKF